MAAWVAPTVCKAVAHLAFPISLDGSQVLLCLHFEGGRSLPQAIFPHHMADNPWCGAGQDCDVIIGGKQPMSGIMH